MKNLHQNFCLAFIVFSLLIVTAQAADGDLDLTFGNGGMMTVDFDGNPDPSGTDQDTGLDTAIQPDGKIIVVGETFLSNTDTVFSATRLNSNGSIDTTFANNGRFMFNPNVGGIQDRAYAVAVQADGKILIAGRTISPRDRVVLRLNSDGSFDTTFGTNGVFRKSIGSPTLDEPELIIQPDGKIIVVGASRPTGATTDAFSVMRLNTDGNLDDTFGVNGQVETVFDQNDRAYGVVLLADGKILVCGGTNFNAGFALAKYNSDGSLDTTFDGDGKVITLFPGMNALLYNIALQPDGKIVGGGYTRGLHSDAAVVRYNSDGSLDTAFGMNGTARFGLTNHETLWDVYVKDGKILGTGTRNPGSGFGSPDDFMLLRFNGDGTLDTGFGNQGVIYTNFGLREFSLTSAFQPDGKLVLAGWRSASMVFNPDYLIARYDYGTKKRPTPLDFNGDGKTDYAVVRGTTLFAPITWYINNNGTEELNAFQFGSGVDIVVPADYDGDGKADIAVYRAGGTAAAPQSYFYIINSSDNTVRIEPWGQRFDVANIMGDYDGDQIADIAVYRPGATTGAESAFYVKKSSDGGFISIQLGIRGDRPVLGDYDGDGKQDFSVYRFSTTTGESDLYTLRSSDGQITTTNLPFTTSFVVPGDYDGDGTTDIATIKNSLNNMVWTISRSSDNVIQTTVAGVYSSSFPVQGDYNADGKTDIAVYYKTGTGSANPSSFWVRQENGSFKVTPWGHGFDNSITSIRAY